MKNQRFILNQRYVLKNDIDRIIIKDVPEEDVNSYYIHPIHAMLLTFFTGEKILRETINEISNHFSIEENIAYNLIKPFLNNKEKVGIQYDGAKFIFPKHLIANADENEIRNDLSIEKINISEPFDFKRQRLSKPDSILFVANTNCYTDCIYCYASKQKCNDLIRTEKLLRVVDNAKSIGVSNFDISGGEFFLLKDWKVILEKVLNCGFKPILSTKIPISYDTIDTLTQLGLDSLQFSLDTLDQDIAVKMLGVKKNYVGKLKESIRKVDSAGIDVILKPTLTKYNANIENVKSILEFASDLKNVKRVLFATTAYSLYKTIDNHLAIKSTSEQIKKVKEYLKLKQEKYKFPINDSVVEFKKSVLCNYKAFSDRSLCIGNVSGIVVLPDGKVGICEELYWNEDFIIGDLNRSSLMEIWTSTKALDLWNLKHLTDKSACKHCFDLEGCRKGLGVCFKFVVSAYGMENPLYPDPRCPKAPELIYDFTDS